MDSEQQQHSSTGGGEDEPTLPKATVYKLISNSLPNHFTITKESKDLISECCVEFVHLLSSESNEISEKESKKTILGEHIVSALRTLGYESFIPQVQEANDEHNKASKDKRKSFRLEDSGLSQEELLKIQEDLFAKARLKLSGQSASATPTGIHIPCNILKDE